MVGHQARRYEMTISFPAITAETILADVSTLAEAKAIARDMRETVLVVQAAHGADSELARSVSDRYFDFIDAIAEAFA
jgi:hypothetical protein